MRLWCHQHHPSSSTLSMTCYCHIPGSVLPHPGAHALEDRRSVERRVDRGTGHWFPPSLLSSFPYEPSTVRNSEQRQWDFLEDRSQTPGQAGGDTNSGILFLQWMQAPTDDLNNLWPIQRSSMVLKTQYSFCASAQTSPIYICTL